MTALDPRHAEVLDELRERSDGLSGPEYVTPKDFPGDVLAYMALLGLLRLSGTKDDRRAWITDQGVSALLSHESEQS